MKTMQVREAKAGFSSLIEDAEQGVPTTITRHGKPAAVIISVADAQRLYAEPRPSFLELLQSFPGDLDIERDQTPIRDIDL